MFRHLFHVFYVLFQLVLIKTDLNQSLEITFEQKLCAASVGK